MTEFHPTRRILFAAPHCLIDSSSGAALATLDQLKLLCRHGFVAKAVCASKLRFPGEADFEQILADVGVKFQVFETRQRASQHDPSPRPSPRKRGEGAFFLMSRGDVPVAVLRTRSTRVDTWEPHEPATLLDEVERTIREFRPHVLLTYGGDAVTRAIIELGKQHGLAVVFGLPNFAYHDRELFRHVDRVIVPSEFSRQWYRERLGLSCEVLPYVIDWIRVQVDRDERVTEGEGVSRREGEEVTADGSSHLSVVSSQSAVVGLSGSQPSALRSQPFLTFVNPQPAKGLFVFARIAEQIARRRPDIPILVMCGRGRDRYGDSEVPSGDHGPVKPHTLPPPCLRSACYRPPRCRSMASWKTS